MTMDIYEKISANYYSTKLPYVTNSKDPVGHDAYNYDQYRLDVEFKRDALEYVGLTNHPKRNKVWSMAWDHGHSSGWSEILYWIVEFSELLND
jgi:hypothetical protein